MLVIGTGKPTLLGLTQADALAEATRARIRAGGHGGWRAWQPCRSSHGRAVRVKRVSATGWRVQVLAAANTLDMEGFAFFLRGGTVLDRSTQPTNPDPSWITEDAWDNITELESQVRRRLPVRRRPDVRLGPTITRRSPGTRCSPGDVRATSGGLPAQGASIRSTRPVLKHCVVMVVGHTGCDRVKAPAVRAVGAPIGRSSRSRHRRMPCSQPACHATGTAERSVARGLRD